MLILKRSCFSRKSFVLVTIFIILAALACYHVLFPEKNYPDQLLQRAIHHMESNYDKLEVDIREEGPGYSLNFKGNIKEQEVVYGNILDYALEVYRNNAGKIFIKSLKDGTWQKAEEAGLEALGSFLLSPFELLNSCSPFFKESRFIGSPGESEKTISLQLPVSFLATTKFLPGKFAQEHRPELSVTIEEEKLFIRQVSLSFYEGNKTAKVFSRTFAFKTTGDYPQNGEKGGGR